MADRLKGKIAIVFGAGSSGPGWGNGKAAAVAYAREGASVACVDLNQAAADETAGIIAGEGGKALALAADVTKLDSTEACVAAAARHFGRIDILHNNVGVTHMGGPVELSEEQFNDPDPALFRETLRKAGFYAEWKKKYGDEAWTILEKAVGSSLS